MTYAERDATLRSLGYFDYAEYLQSGLWRAIRDGVIRNANGKCHLCESPAREVHHRSYAESVLAGEVRDKSVLVALCDTCHTAIEFKGKAKRTFSEVESTLQRMEGRNRTSGKQNKRKRQAKRIARPMCVRCKDRPVATNYFGQLSKFCQHCKTKTQPSDAARIFNEMRQRDGE